MADLAGAVAKLDRAEEHLATLDASLTVWRGANRNPFTNAQNPDKTEIRHYLNFDVPPDLVRWGVLAGDCVHNLRSALDHLAWEASTIKDGSVEFPVFKDRDKFLSTERGGGLHKIRGIERAEAREIIKRYQPWGNPNGFDQDSLWLIHEFDRMDKHQVLTPVGILLREMNLDMVIEYAEGGIVGVPVISGESFQLKQGAEAFTMHFPSPFKRVQVKAGLTLGIGIEYGGRAGGITGTLGNLSKHARRVVEELGDALV